MPFELDSGKVVRFDFDKITARDFDDFEDATGGVDLVTFAETLQTIDYAEGLRQREYRIPMMAFIWLALRKSYPGLTFDEVYDEIGIAEAGTVIELAQVKHPTNVTRVPAVAKPPAQRGARRTPKTP